MRPSGAWLCATALLAGCAHGSARGREGALRWSYKVEVPPALDRLAVEVCFSGPPPRRLSVDSDLPEAIRAVEDLSADGGAPKVDLVGASLVLGDLPDDACVRYKVVLDRLFEEAGSRQSGRFGDVVSLDPRLVLWRPPRLYLEAQVDLEWVLPPGLSASVPWEARGEGRYRLPVTALMWASQTLLGPLVQRRFEASGATFDLAIIDRPRRLTEAGAQRWISTAAETVAALHGRFPTDRMQVVVLPIAGGGSPVYFGMALRGGGPAVFLLASSEAHDHAFPGEWVAIHEFLHHGMPLIQPAGAWLSEGVVTYYTEVLPTRRGFRSELAGWRSIHDGFGRGRRDGTGLALEGESRDMHDTHSYQRVYWGGAAIALLADTALRTAGKGSLDAAMIHLRDCCAGTPRIWSPAEVLQELDVWAQEPFFAPLAGAWLRASDFPDLAETYRKLGLDVIKGELSLNETAPAADVRRAIFARPP